MFQNVCVCLYVCVCVCVCVSVCLKNVYGLCARDTIDPEESSLTDEERPLTRNELQERVLKGVRTALWDSGREGYGPWDCVYMITQ